MPKAQELYVAMAVDPRTLSIVSKGTLVTAYTRTLVSTTLLLRQPGNDLLTRLPNGPISVFISPFLTTQ